MSELLDGKGLAHKLGIGEATLYRWKRLGWLKKFEVTQPMGTRRYSGIKVDKWLAGESVVRLGRGARG